MERAQMDMLASKDQALAMCSAVPGSGTTLMTGWTCGSLPRPLRSKILWHGGMESTGKPCEHALPSLLTPILRWGFSPFAGDGNGFKLGASIENSPAGDHIIRNNIAFANLKKGFIDNGNPGKLVVSRNTAWNNGDTGFVWRSSVSNLTVNIGAINVNAQATVNTNSTQSGNSWNVGGTWNNATFKSVDASILKGPRQASGKITPSDFLIPTSGAAIGATTRT